VIEYGDVGDFVSGDVVADEGGSEDESPIEGEFLGVCLTASPLGGGIDDADGSVEGDVEFLGKVGDGVKESGAGAFFEEVFDASFDVFSLSPDEEFVF
jgi:hypothetical protein